MIFIFAMIFSIPPLFSDAAYLIEYGKRARKTEASSFRYKVFIQTGDLKQKIRATNTHPKRAARFHSSFSLEKVHEEKALFFQKTLANPVNMCYHIDRVPVIRLYKVVPRTLLMQGCCMPVHSPPVFFLF